MYSVQENIKLTYRCGNLLNSSKIVCQMIVVIIVDVFCIEAAENRCILYENFGSRQNLVCPKIIIVIVDVFSTGTAKNLLVFTENH
jgi:hypothetical protein